MTVRCASPDVDDYFDAATETYKDVFVSVSELDGQFRQDTQLRFTFVGHVTVDSVYPDWAY